MGYNEHPRQKLPRVLLEMQAIVCVSAFVFARRSRVFQRASNVPVWKSTAGPVNHSLSSNFFPLESKLTTCSNSAVCGKIKITFYWLQKILFLHSDKKHVKALLRSASCSSKLSIAVQSMPWQKIEFILLCINHTFYKKSPITVPGVNMQVCSICPDAPPTLSNVTCLDLAQLAILK